MYVSIFGCTYGSCTLLVCSLVHIAHSAFSSIPKSAFINRMKVINTSIVIKVPENVTVDVKARNVTVTGPRGTLKKSFRHMDVEIIPQDKTVKLQLWFGKRQQIACLRTIASHIENMFKGVTKGFQYKLKAVYAHFPINMNVTDKNKTLEIRNYLGEKTFRRIPMLDGVTVTNSSVKDEIILVGNDINNVSQSAASIQQSTRVTNKDIRKFLDGVYVSERGVIKAKGE